MRVVKITDNWLEKKQEFINASINCPKFSVEEMRKKTLEAPRWVHFGGGNLYRCFHAKVAQDLLNDGLMESGIVVADMFNAALIEHYKQTDNRTLSVVLKADGTTEKELVASTAAAYFLNASDFQVVQTLSDIFQKTSLQLATFTITEKGYIVTGFDGKLTVQAKADIASGAYFNKLQTSIGKLTFLLYKRYQAGAYPLALVSTDNFSHNGARLEESILTIAKGWVKNGAVDRGFVDYLQNKQVISFPFSMIDRITPLPSQEVGQSLTSSGVQGMAVSEGETFASFVNTEETHYLIIEDDFPNGRPAFEQAGIYLTTRETVNQADLMKVCACLNPLHTALAIFGCLFGYQRIWAEMHDQDLVDLIKQIAYSESLPVVVAPKIIDPQVFLDEVINQRFINQAIPDSPQRIATDTSQKLAIRFGETIKAYLASAELHVQTLHFIPLTIAAWCRYLLGIDDFGQPMLLSSDPLLDELKNHLKGIQIGQQIEQEEVEKALSPILSNEQIFGVNLYRASLGEKVEGFFLRLVKEPGAVRAVLQEELAQRENC